MNKSIIIFGVLLLFGVAYSAPITKVGQAWTITKQDGFTGIYDYTLTQDTEGAQICWKVPREIKEGRGSDLERESGLSASAFNAELAKVKSQDLKRADGSVIKQLDMSKDGCWVLDKKVGKYSIGSATVEVVYANITIQVDMIENTDHCFYDCHTDYEVCSNATITQGILDTIFLDMSTLSETELSYSAVKQERNFTYNETRYSTSCANITVANGTYEECNSTPYSVELTGTGYFAVEDYTGCSKIRVEGRKDAMASVDNVLCVYDVCFPEWAVWNSYGSIPYWADANSGVWINVSLNTTTPLQVLFNKTSTDLGNGSLVFLFFDGFDGTTLDNTTWTNMGGTTVTYGNGHVNVAKSATHYSGIATKQTWNRGVSVYSYCKASDDDTLMAGFSTNTPAGYYVNSALVYAQGTVFNNYVYTGYADRRQTTTKARDTSFHFWKTTWLASGVNLTIDGTSYGGDTSSSPAVALPVTIRQGLGETNCSWIAVGNANPSEPTVSCVDISATQVLCNITTTVNLTGYQVRIPYEYFNTTNLTAEIGNYSGSDFVSNNITLGPSELYKNSTAYCEVNWTHQTNSTFNVFMGIMNGSTILDAYNQSNLGYTNGTLWNYTNFSMNDFTTGDNITCWSYANNSETESEIVYSTTITIGNLGPVADNLTITSPLYNGSDATGTADIYDVESHNISCRFEWFRNSTSIYNDTQAVCLNSSTLDAANYSTTDILFYRLYTNDSLGANGTMVQSANTTVSPPFVWNNYTYNAEMYETVYYTWTANFTLPIGDENGTAKLEFNGVNTSASCTNASNTYTCTISLPAPPVSVNGTEKNGTWWVSYDSLVSGAVSTSQSFNQNVYWGLWATEVASNTQATSQGNVYVNVSYSNTPGLTGTISGVAWLLGETTTGTFTCSGGLCAATFSAPATTTAIIRQTMANLTLTSSYWGTSATREVFITGSGTLTAGNATMATSGSITNPNNANDSNWGTYASYATTGAYQIFNYSLPQIYSLGNYNTRFVSTYANTAIPQECWGTELSFKILRDGTVFRVYCYNYTSEGYSQFYQMTPGSYYYFYEQNATFTLNNTNVRIVPYGLTNCTIGVPLFNYSCYDEDDGSSIACDYSQTFILTTEAGEEINTFSGTDTNWQICVYPDTLTGNISSMEQVTASGYRVSEYYLSQVSIEDGSYALDRYIVQTTPSKLTIIKVREDGALVADATIYAQKYFVSEDAFHTVGMTRTGDGGEGPLYLIPIDVWYKFVVLEDGEVVYTSNTQKVICAEEDYTCHVYLNIEETGVDYFTYNDEISGSCSFNSGTNQLACTWADASGLMQYARLRVMKAGITTLTTVCDVNSTDVSGTLYCNLSAGNGTYTYSFMSKYNPEYSLSTGSIEIGELANIFGGSGLLLSFMIFISLAMIGVWSPPVGIVLGLFGVLASWGLGLVSPEVGWSSMVGLVISGVILAYKMRA